MRRRFNNYRSKRGYGTKKSFSRRATYLPKEGRALVGGRVARAQSATVGQVGKIGDQIKEGILEGIEDILSVIITYLPTSVNVQPGPQTQGPLSEDLSGSDEGGEVGESGETVGSEVPEEQAMDLDDDAEESQTVFSRPPNIGPVNFIEPVPETKKQGPEDPRAALRRLVADKKKEICQAVQGPYILNAMGSSIQKKKVFRK